MIASLAKNEAKISDEMKKSKGWLNSYLRIDSLIIYWDFRENLNLKFFLFISYNNEKNFLKDDLFWNIYEEKEWKKITEKKHMVYEIY